MMGLFRFVALLLISIPLAAAHGPEILPGAVVNTLAPNIRFDASAATNGAEELIVWVDRRGGVSAIVATRIRNGAVVDPLGILIAKGPDQTLPEVVSIDNSWLIVWTENTDGRNRVVAARLSRDGTILVPAKVLADDAGGSLRHLAVIGSRAVTVFRSNGEVHALVLDANANVLAHHTLATGQASRNNPSVTASATQFLVLWDESGFGNPSLIYAVRLSAAGTVLTAAPRKVGEGQLASAASDGSGFAVVAYESDSGRWTTFRIAPNLSATPAVIFPATTQAWPLSAIWTGTRYAAIGIAAPQQLYVSFLGDDGASTPHILPWPAGMFDEVSVLPVRGELLITSMRSTNSDIRVIAHAARFDASSLASRGEEMLLSWSGNEHDAPRVAFDGTNYLVVWREIDGVFATRVTLDGRSLDGRGIELRGASPLWRDYAPRVVFDGTQYVIAWTDSARARIVFRFIDPATGAITDSRELETEQPLPVLAMTAGGEATLVVWSDAFGQPTATRVDRASHTLSAPITLARPGHRIGLASAAWNGTHFLVAWEHWLLLPPAHVRTPVRIRGTRVTPSLGVLDTDPLHLGDSGGDQVLDTAPVVASNGDEWLVAWRSGSGSLRARRIAANGLGIGTAEGTFDRFTAGPTIFTSAIWDGSRYVLTSSTGAAVEVLWLTPTLDITGASTLTTDAASPSVSLVNTTNGVSALYLRQIWDAPYAGVNRSVLRQLARPVRRRAMR